MYAEEEMWLWMGKETIWEKWSALFRKKTVFSNFLNFYSYIFISLENLTKTSAFFFWIPLLLYFRINFKQNAVRHLKKRVWRDQLILKSKTSIGLWFKNTLVTDSRTHWFLTQRSTGFSWLWDHLVSDSRTNWFLTKRPTGPWLKDQLVPPDSRMKWAPMRTRVV